MRLKLAYEKELILPNLPTYNERIGYINKYIFNNTDYIVNESDNRLTFEQYYNINSLISRNENEKKQMRERWLGIKRVGSRYKDESFKNTLDFITGYVLDSKNHSVKHEIHRFKVLKRKENSDSLLSESEKEELSELEKNVICFRLEGSDIVFFINHSYENHLRNRIRESEDGNFRDNMKIKLDMCGKIKKKARRVSGRLQKLDDQLKEIKIEVRELYNELKKDRNNDELFKKVSEKIKSSRYFRKRIQEYEFEMQQLVSDYQLITELQVAYQ